MKAPNTQDWREKATISVDEAGELVGLCRGSAYVAARRGDLPTIKIGGRIRVLVKPLAAMLDGAA